MLSGKTEDVILAKEERNAVASCTAGWATDLLLFVQHDVGFEAGDAGELFIAHRAGEVGGCVCGLVQREVELHVERLRALVTSMRLQEKETSQRLMWLEPWFEICKLALAVAVLTINTRRRGVIRI